MTATNESLGSESNQSLSAMAAAVAVSNESLDGIVKQSSLGQEGQATRSLSVVRALEVCQWDDSNQGVSP